jgi:filamentous hemagglutinin family protein
MVNTAATPRHSLRSARSIRRKAVAIAVAACFSGGAAQANPTNPAVVHGTATFQQAGGVLNVTNSQNAIINWGSFSIGVNELTRFIQPSALSAVLNRVTGQDPSAILGALQSNGRVFLINPNGIMFGAGAQINVAGLVASTLNLSNADFLAGRMNFTDGTGAGSVVNQGSINAGGGPVYLVGNAVTNHGLITSPQGEIVLAAGNSVELVNPGTPNLRVEIQADSNEARNLGNMVADAGRIGIYAGLIKQGGIINADSAVSEGGRIILKSTKLTDIEAGSVTSAKGSSGGQILVLSDMQQGTTNVQGAIDASSNAVGVAGNGGFIDTSGGQILIGSGVSINTTGANGGANGTWLIDPVYDFHIGGVDANIDAATLVTALASNSVVIATANTGAPDYYGGGYFGSATWPNPIPSGNGDLFVNDSVVWNSGNSLTLTALRNVQVDNAITNAGSGDIRIFAGWDGSSSPAAPTLLTSGAIQLNAPISTGGVVKLQATDVIGQSASGAIAASGLLAISTGNTVNLATATNSVGTLAGSAKGQFALKNSGNLAVGAVSGVNGIEVNGASPGMHATLGLEVTGGNLTISKPVFVTGGSAIEMGYGGNASIAFTASGSITVNDSVQANGGDAGSASFMNTSGFAGGNAQVTMSAGNMLAVSSTGFVNANGGSGGYPYEGGAGGNGGTALLQLTAAGNITVDGDISAIGGDMGYGSSGGGTGGNATVRLTSTGGTLTLANNITVSADGGGGERSGSVAGHALVDLKSESTLGIVGNSTVQATGGLGSDGAQSGNGQVKIASTGGSFTIDGSTIAANGGDADFYSSGNGGNGTVQIEAPGNVTIVNSTMAGNGGDGAEGGSGGGGVVLVSATGGITVANNSNLSANGGDTGSSYYYSGSGIGGGAGLTMLAGGAIVIDGSEGLATGGIGDVGGNAAINIVNGGSFNLANAGLLTANSGYRMDMSTPGLASVLVASAGNLALDASTISTDGAIGLGGGNIIFDNGGSATGATSASASTSGALTLSNDSSITGGNGNTYITTGGDLLVQSDSSIYGTPDVVMKVGGKVRMNSGGVIEAGSANTLRLTFANPSTGGIVINGINGLVYDSATGTGFIAGGSPAVLGGSLIVSFDNNTVTTTTQNVPTQTLITALTEAIKPLAKDESSGTLDEKEDPKKKKDAPACR